MRFYLSFIVCLVALSLGGCELGKNYTKQDRAGNLELQDFRDGLSERVPEIDEWADVKNAANIPDFQPYISSGSDDLKPMPLVSISVNQSVPLRDIFYELAQQADYDIELDPRITGSIIFTARNKPLDAVVERIADVAGLRFRFKDDTLRVELDTPYNKVYKLDYLSYTRSNTSTASTNVNVSGDADGTATSSGSSFSTSAESESDLWGELAANLEQILAGQASGVLRTSADPRVTAVDQNPNVQPVVSGGGAVQPPDAVLRVETLPLDDGLSGQPAAPEIEIAPSAFTLNKQAGLVNVFATERQHKEVDNYLKLLRRAVTSQVLIEAKVLEVSLNDQYAAGIDWRVMDVFNNNGALNFLGDGFGALDTLAAGAGDTLGITPPITTTGNSNFVVGYAGDDIQALVEAIAEFGTVRALASPRITVMNNQSALLNVATNRVFFELDIDITEGTDGAGDRTTIESTIRNVPEGVLINVLPSINLDKGTVSMALRPTITSVANQVADPGVAFLGVGIQSLIPELNVQELDTVVRVRSGRPIVMGGLLQDRVSSDTSQVPVLGEMPLVGPLFKNQQDTISKSEIVILMKATILDQPEDSIHSTDRDLYKMFSSDRRPFQL